MDAAPPRWRPAGPFVPPHPTDAQPEVEAREILDRAEERVPNGERDVNRLLADLEVREAALTAR